MNIISAMMSMSLFSLLMSGLKSMKHMSEPCAFNPQKATWGQI